MNGRWSTSDAVQARILDGALRVFEARGYSAASMAEIVETSGASIGSIYHHFGGKDVLFDACYLRLRDHLRADVGIDDLENHPRGTWEQDYLWAVRGRREECAVFLGLDTPAGFDPARQVASYFAETGEHSARVLAAIVVECMRMLCECPDDEVARVIDPTVKLINVVRAVGF